ncbi:NAD-dependent epimerase/dehydratase family protein [Acuticoccus kandeliae]|uniref:NAD-dependent epimerase/dehydratase family protein n=1 Tax=Acuticoccus kandeliae TaxID=2073160 RepID=UPI000D3E5A48|nr:NAD(P)-dependent oxidoreductase [Acuticoccus kandeliae]
MRFNKVLVTGAGGLLGRAVVKELDGKCSVAGFDIAAGAADITWHVGDLLDAKSVAEAVAGQDAILHIAAMPNIWSGNGERIMSVNVVGTWNILEQAEAAGVKRVVLCSSDSVYGFTVREGAMQPPLYLPIDDEHPRQPTDPYALSKLMVEEAGRAFVARGKLEVIVLRPVFVSYPEMYGEIAARAKDPAAYKGPMVGGPSSAGGGPAWHHIDPRDAARAFRLALELENVTYDRFVISASRTLAPEPTLPRLERALGKLPEVRDPALYEANPYAPLYDLTRTREVLGFVAEHDTIPVPTEPTPA